MGLKSLIKTRVRSFSYHATYLLFMVTKILFQNLLKNSAKISQFRFNFCEILSFGRTKLSINKCSINPNKADIFRTCFTFCNLSNPRDKISYGHYSSCFTYSENIYEMINPLFNNLDFCSTISITLAVHLKHENG